MTAEGVGWEVSQVLYAAYKCVDKEHADGTKEWHEQWDDLISLLLLFHHPDNRLGWRKYTTVIHNCKWCHPPGGAVLWGCLKLRTG